VEKGLKNHLIHRGGKASGKWPKNLHPIPNNQPTSRNAIATLGAAPP